MSDTITLLAPFGGWLAPIEEVPDPVFAERMMGDGFAIDPVEGVLRAPAAGEVISVPESAHAVTLRLENGAELLLHVGLETVALGGQGFAAQVVAGERVKAGDALIAFDLDAVAATARTLITPVVVASQGYTLELDSTGVHHLDPVRVVGVDAERMRIELQRPLLDRLQVELVGGRGRSAHGVVLGGRAGGGARGQREERGERKGVQEGGAGHQWTSVVDCAALVLGPVDASSAGAAPASTRRRRHTLMKRSNRRRRMGAGLTAWLARLGRAAGWNPVGHRHRNDAGRAMSQQATARCRMRARPFVG